MKPLHAASLTALTFALASCNLNGTTPKPTDQAFRDQTLTWQTCDHTILGWDASETFTALGKRVECADMNVPTDWAHPDRGSSSVSLIRVKAANPEQRQGAIFFNPGGPGGDGLAFAPSFAAAWGEADTTTSVGANLRKLTEQFDLIGFSPRGVGASTRLYCGSNELLPTVNPPASDRSEQNINNMIRSGKLVAAACQKNPLTPFINTDATVQDLDLARHLLGDQKLNYIGYSYGTWLGSWYAKRYPQNTGRMLLDGNMPFHATMQAAFESDPMTFQRDYREVAVPQMARTHALLDLGATPDEVYARYSALGEPLKTLLGSFSAQMLYQRDNYPFLGIALKITVVVDSFVKAEPDISTEELYARATQATYFPVPALNEAARGFAAQLVEARHAFLTAAPTPLELGASAATNTAVVCNDTAWNQDLAYWRAQDERNARDFPLIGGSLISMPCLAWKGGPSVQKPAVPANMPPLLLLQNEYDPATPREGALAALKATPGATMIMIDNEPQHAAFPYGTECVDLPITRYFLTGTLPAAQLNACQALPLPGEDRVYPVGETFVTGALGAQAAGRPAITSAAGQRALALNRRIIAEQSAALHGLTSSLDLSGLRAALGK